MKQIHTGHGRSYPHPLQMAAMVALLSTVACVSAPAEGTDGVPVSDVSTVSLSGFVSQQLTNDVDFVTSSLPVDVDLIWGVLPGVYQQLGIPVGTSNFDTKEVGNLGFEVQRVGGSRMNKYLDCGTGRTGPMANAYQVTLSVLTRLAGTDAGQTEISTMVDGTAVNRSIAGYPVGCTSRETLEELIVEKVAEALGLSGS